MKSKKNILFLSSWYPNKKEPTNGNFVQRHAEAVALYNTVFALHVVTLPNLKQNYTEEFVLDGVNTKIIYLQKSKNPFKNWQNKTKAYKNELKTQQIDIIHCNVFFPIGFLAYKHAKKRNIPFVCSEHWTFFLKEQDSLLAFLIKQFYSYFGSKADVFLPVSETLKNELIKNNVKSSFKVIGNVIDPSLFKFKENKEPNNKFTLVHISTFKDEHKNISGILDAVKSVYKENKNIVLKLIGDGDLDALSELIKSKNIPEDLIEVEGTKTPSEIAEILQKSDLYISFSNYETFGIVMIEALLCGSNVVSTNTGILPELKENASFKIIDKKDTKALKNTILYYLQNKEIKPTEKFRNYLISKFSKEAIGQSFNKVYKDLLT